MYRAGLPIVRIGQYLIKFFAIRKANITGSQLDKVEATLIEENWIKIEPEEFVRIVYGQYTTADNVIPFRRRKVKP